MAPALAVLSTISSIVDTTNNEALSPKSNVMAWSCNELKVKVVRPRYASNQSVAVQWSDRNVNGVRADLSSR